MRLHRRIFIVKKYYPDEHYIISLRRRYDDDREYISKKHLLDWLIKEKNMATVASPIQASAYKRVIDRINRM